MSKSRKREHRIRIRTSKQALWNSLVDPDEIIRWYALDARVEPGRGGRMLLSWGEEFAARLSIVEWEPEEHLRLVHELEAPVTEDFFLEVDGESVVLRLVQSEIPDSSDWDDFYEETNRGWKLFFAGLRHYLERHLGQARVNVTFMHPIRVSIEEAWNKLLGPNGLAAVGSLESLSVGVKRKLTTAFGQTLLTEVLVYEPPYTLSMTIDNLEDSLLALDFERNGARTLLYCNLSTFEMKPERVEALRLDWKAWIERLFPSPLGGST